MCKVMKLAQEIIGLWPCITLGSGVLRKGRHSYGFGMIQEMNVLWSGKLNQLGELKVFFFVEWTLFTWPGELDLLAIFPEVIISRLELVTLILNAFRG